MKKQVFNPYLPLSEYVPDGEPHIFNDRVLWGHKNTYFSKALFEILKNNKIDIFIKSEVEGYRYLQIPEGKYCLDEDINNPLNVSA